jgi:hypothetical protein
MSIAVRTSTDDSTVVDSVHGETGNVGNGDGDYDGDGGGGGEGERCEEEERMNPQEEYMVVSPLTVEQDTENDEGNEDRYITAGAAGTTGEPSMGNKILKTLMCGC